MDKYKILDSYWYTSTFPGADVILHVIAGLPNIAVVFVAIDIGDGKWKCYMGWVPSPDNANGADEKALEQLIAAHGAKVSEAVAIAHFPSLDPKGATF